MFVAEFNCIFPLIKEGNSHRMQLPAYVLILSPLPKNSIKKNGFRSQRMCCCFDDHTISYGVSNFS